MTKCPTCPEEMTYMGYNKKTELHLWYCYECREYIENDEKPPTKDQKEAGRYLPYIYQLEEVNKALRLENRKLKEVVRRDSE